MRIFRSGSVRNRSLVVAVRIENFNASKCDLRAPVYVIEAIGFEKCYSRARHSGPVAMSKMHKAGLLDKQRFYMLTSRLILGLPIGYHDGSHFPFPPNPAIWRFRRGSSHRRTAQTRRA